MNLPSVEERTWLGRYLRKLIERMGAEQFLCAAIVQPSPRYFPDPWSGTVADVHRLTQRLMSLAGLGHLTFSLSGFDESSDSWDAGTAGWFAGIRNGRCHFGVHVGQLRDPEAAVGVMAHEVAHAWRHHHHLVADARDLEELITDLTTIYLGFGVFTTNNTDRYRSSSDWNVTSWSISSAGYLPPPSMAWALALQVAARGDRVEANAVARDLEPNQQAAFHEATEEIERDSSWLEGLALPAARPKRWRYELIAIREPDESEIEEIEEETPDPRRNAGVMVYRVAKTDIFKTLFMGLWPGLAVGMFVPLMFGIENRRAISILTIGCASISLIWTILRTWRYACSDRDCGTIVTAETAACPGCGGILGGKISERQLARLRYEELERKAAETGYEECDQCQPEQPCARHA
jgi:Peptidase family M48